MEDLRRTLVAGLLLCTAGVVSCPLAIAQEQVDHLLQAASHLEQAGLLEMATNVRKVAADQLGSEKQKLLREKLAQLKQLEAEIAQLQQIAGSQPRVMIHAKVYQLIPGKAQSGLGLVSLQNLLSEDKATFMVDEEGTLTQFVEFLRQQGMMKVLAEPTLLTVAGRKASIVVGGEQPVSQGSNPGPGASSFSGLHLECIAEILEDGRVALDLHLRISETPGKSNDSGANESRKIDLHSKATMKPGQMALMSSPCQQTGENTQRGIFVLLRTELMDSDGG